MEQDAQNRFRMMRATCAQLHELRSMWTANLMMQTDVVRLEQVIGDILTANAKILTAAGKAQRQVCKARKQAAIDATMTLVNITRNWAEEAPGQELLLRRISVREYQLRPMSDADLVARLEEINALCAAAGPAILENPLTAEHYSYAATCLGAFKGMQDDARKSDVERQGENGNLAGLFKRGSQILRRIDRLMENYKQSHPVELGKYRAARTIFDYGTGRKSRGAAGDPGAPGSGNEGPDGKGDAAPDAAPDGRVG